MGDEAEEGPAQENEEESAEENDCREHFAFLHEESDCLGRANEEAQSH